MLSPRRFAPTLLASTLLACGPSIDTGLGQGASDYQLFGKRLLEIEGTLATGAAGPLTLDFGDLADGEWTSACLLGGYTDPIQVMQKKAASIATEDKARIDALSTFLGPDVVEEYDMMIAYVDLRNVARFIYFEQGIGPQGQHFEAYAAKPETTVHVFPPDWMERP